VRRNKKSLTWPFSVLTMRLCDAAIALRKEAKDLDRQPEHPDLEGPGF